MAFRSPTDVLQGELDLFPKTRKVPFISFLWMESSSSHESITQ